MVILLVALFLFCVLIDANIEGVLFIMDDLFIVYGSESVLLVPLYKRINTFFIKVFNESIPQKDTKSIDVDACR